ncbi:MAG: lipopolysaccharide biosynthesis protein [Sulfuricella sp.]|nr:lipopolysaccharide biosynthesis protein [Sulfuricella sp.]
MSIRSRFLITIVANIARAVLSFATGLILARGLGPHDYGNFAFLVGTFMALRQLLDMGTSTAFYTFLSQKPRGHFFIASYAGWQFLQFSLPFFIIALLLPRQWAELIWAGQDRGLVLLAFVAVFMQQQVWQMMAQIGDSMRQTRRVQGISVGIAAVHLVLVLLLWQMQVLSLRWLFWLIFVEYFVAACLAYKFIPLPNSESVEINLKSLVRQYADYCKPLVAFSWLGFAYSFADNWLLRTYGGAKELAFYSVANQFAMISLLATTSIMQIFWKELAEAHQNQDRQRVAMIYQKVSRFLFFFGALVSGFLLPWSKEITGWTLGIEYLDGAPVLAVMFLFPMYAAMGQIGGTMFYATENARPKVVIETILMLVSIPAAYFVQAPHDALIPGLALGGLGMAVQKVALIAVANNVMTWWLARTHGWEFDWKCQVTSLGGALLVGGLSYWIVSMAGMKTIAAFVLAGALYAVTMFALIWRHPQMAGMTKEEINGYMFKVFRFMRLI